MENKRKIQETNEYCLIMESTKEQEMLEAAAVHLILLKNPNLNLQQYSTCNNAYVSDEGVFKKKQDYRVKGVVNHTKNNKDASSVTSCTSSSSGVSIKSVISMERTAVGRHHRNRLRSIVDIYSVTRPL
ncbi:hypothetical protein HanXRQr2_Chr16g0750551 [Helianthus annuus]|uniref:Uncharacterized protein n=1 Tax=Helianthus annuus TaxID=4232 RepID=A0A9K3GYA7_HELAN|nr:hypothetical protein HanXRQr2_Chr16g0750551 [Helianthus annuus]